MQKVTELNFFNGWKVGFSAGLVLGEKWEWFWGFGEKCLMPKPLPPRNQCPGWFAPA